VIDESGLQNEEHLESRISAFLGIKIGSSDENENVSDSIRVNCESDSNTIETICQFLFRKTIDTGIHSCTISTPDTGEKVAMSTWSPSTTARHSENSVESEPSIFYLDERDLQHESQEIFDIEGKCISGSQS
jgi:hypothetical protein